MYIMRNEENETTCKNEQEIMERERDRKEGRSKGRRDACEPAAVVAAATFRLTSKFTFVDVGLDDLYVLLGAPVAHLLLLIKLNVHAHNSTSP